MQLGMNYRKLLPRWRQRKKVQEARRAREALRMGSNPVQQGYEHGVQQSNMNFRGSQRGRWWRGNGFGNCGHPRPTQPSSQRCVFLCVSVGIIHVLIGRLVTRWNVGR